MPIIKYGEGLSVRWTLDEMKKIELYRKAAAQRRADGIERKPIGSARRVAAEVWADV